MAKYGLRIRDKDGNITFDSTMRFPQYRGSVYTGDQDGVQVIPDQNAEVWFAAVFDQTIGTTVVKIPPTITIEGSTIKWTFQAGVTKAVGTIYYGIY